MERSGWRRAVGRSSRMTAAAFLMGSCSLVSLAAAPAASAVAAADHRGHLVPASAVVVNNPGPQDDFQFDRVSLQMTASGGTPPYHWSAVSLPLRLTIDPSTGLISGEILSSTNTTPTVKATDSRGQFGTVSFFWRIECC